MFADIGETVNLTLTFIANPAANHILWKEPQNKLTYTVNDTIDLGEDQFQTMLEVKVVDKDSYGEYFCEIRNKIGESLKILVNIVKKGERFIFALLSR